MFRPHSTKRRSNYDPFRYMALQRRKSYYIALMLYYIGLFAVLLWIIAAWKARF